MAVMLVFFGIAIAVVIVRGKYNANDDHANRYGKDGDIEKL